VTGGALADWLATLPPDWLRDVDPAAIEAARAAYDEPPRHYHTWDHAVACVELLRTVPVQRPRPVFLALVFHDAVYVAGRADNEALSAELATALLAAPARLPADELESIARMIRATRDHHALADGLSPDERAMLDLDLAVLAAPWDVYRRYADGVEREYVPAVVSPPRFRVGRGEFLERLLARPRLYLTDAGEARWGAVARANAARELAELRARQGWGERLVAAARRIAR
jgi:predicted metal-dependent HD superfamily phosphohydrolase